MASSKLKRNQMRYSIYDRTTTCLIPLVFAFITIAIISLCAFFLYRFLILTFDPMVFPLLLVFILPWGYTLHESLRTGYLQRLFLRFGVDKTGIHGSYLGWKPFVISWDSVRTYAVFAQTDYRYPHTLIMFSTDPDELAPPNYVAANQVNPGRLIVVYRDDVWDALKSNMPVDMEKKMSYALERKQSCFCKKRT